MANTSIWATDRIEDSFDIGCRVVKWDEPNGFGFKNNFINTGAKDLQTLKNKIKQFTIHWSVTKTAKSLHTGLNARSLSVNFGIDDDENENGFATIYQYLPVSKLGYSQGTVDNISYNALGPGVELCYAPQAWEGDQYKGSNKHPIIIAPIHGTKLKVHLPSNAQMNSLKALTWGVTELFNIPAEFPKINGNYNTTVLNNCHQYTGLLNHYNIKRSKIDTAGLDMKSIENYCLSKQNII